MADNLTYEQRKRCMQSNRSKWTSIEILLHNYLKGNKIKHKMHPNIDGSPDILLVNKNIAVFIHGCFWHKCPKCYKEPKTNIEYWIPKIDKNNKRDKQNTRILKKQGYLVRVIWEHDLKKEKRVITINKLVHLA